MIHRKPERNFRNKSLTDELIDLDRHLVSLLAQRTRLLAKAASSRRAKGKPAADPNQERMMRPIWDRLVREHHMDIRSVRRILDAANGLAYSLPSSRDRTPDSFVLSPAQGEADFDQPGPRSTLRARCWTALAALSGKAMTLNDATLNDPQADLIKALNQAGGDLSWEGAKVSSREGKVLAFADKTVYAGLDEFNFFLLLALSMPQTGHWTFTAGGALKDIDLSQVVAVAARMGARLTSVTPYSSGLPLRVESAGLTNTTVTLPREFPPLAALALALAGPAYPQGLTMNFDKDWPGAAMLEPAVSLLGQCGVDCSLKAGQLRVPQKALKIPAVPSLPLDPILCAPILAMPVMRQGTARLTGSWPTDDPRARATEALLAAAGLDVKVGRGAVTAAPGKMPESFDFDCRQVAELIPLAAALTLASPGDARVSAPLESADSDAAEALLARAGRFVRAREGRLVSVRCREDDGRDKRREPWVAPGPLWIMASVLVSLAAPGLALANPGDMAAVWPGFWTLYSERFGPRDAKKQEKPSDDRPPRRRFRLG